MAERKMGQLGKRRGEAKYEEGLEGVVIVGRWADGDLTQS